ncbi:hypothetical protein O181_042701 [Austropuccinia psidii MF-1]|uniref:Uncharacterized protein n=1 Tax=Austropuccinia psidii MF-1 TaxID=1389203 RepID=A0A9Q3DM44_9BASI|nr:hypothetical protein [Austropuccinia psidii MF-1]
MNRSIINWKRLLLLLQIHWKPSLQLWPEPNRYLTNPHLPDKSVLYDAIFPESLHPHVNLNPSYPNHINAVGGEAQVQPSRADISLRDITPYHQASSANWLQNTNSYSDHFSINHHIHNKHILHEPSVQEPFVPNVDTELFVSNLNALWDDSQALAVTDLSSRGIASPQHVEFRNPGLGISSDRSLSPTGLECTSEVSTMNANVLPHQTRENQQISFRESKKPFNTMLFKNIPTLSRTHQASNEQPLESLSQDLDRYQLLSQFPGFTTNDWLHPLENKQQNHESQIYALQSNHDIASSSHASQIVELEPVEFRKPPTKENEQKKRRRIQTDEQAVDQNPNRPQVRALPERLTKESVCDWFASSLRFPTIYIQIGNQIQRIQDYTHTLFVESFKEIVDFSNHLSLLEPKYFNLYYLLMHIAVLHTRIIDLFFPLTDKDERIIREMWIFVSMIKKEIVQLKEKKDPPLVLNNFQKSVLEYLSNHSSVDRRLPWLQSGESVGKGDPVAMKIAVDFVESYLVNLNSQKFKGVYEDSETFLKFVDKLGRTIGANAMNSWRENVERRLEKGELLPWKEKLNLATLERSKYKWSFPALLSSRKPRNKRKEKQPTISSEKTQQLISS